MIRAFLLACIALLTAACGAQPQSVAHFDAGKYPANLSTWGVIRVDDSRLVLGAGFQPYDLNTPLFTDYAHKLRAIWLPPGTQAHYDPDGVFDLPVGTIISKTFYYPKANKPAERAAAHGGYEPGFQRRRSQPAHS